MIEKINLSPLWPFSFWPFWFRIAGLLGLVALLAWLPLTSARGELEKFHLIYLVSAVDLKPGSKAFVDPIFFTDGEKIVGFHEYCKTHTPVLRSDQISGDQEIIRKYCRQEDFQFDPVGHHTLNNHGLSVQLTPIRFTRSLRGETVMMGHSTVASTGQSTIEFPSLRRNDSAPEYFLLMSRDRSVLARMVSVATTNRAEVMSLLTKARSYAEEARGRTSGGREYKLLREEFMTSGNVSLANPIFADLDKDGRLDLVVGVHAVYVPKIKSSAPNMNWLAVAYIYGRSHQLLGHQVEIDPAGPYERLRMSGSAYQRLIENGYPAMAPLVVLSIRNCTYVLRHFWDVAMEYPFGLRLENAQSPNKRDDPCRDLRLDKLQVPL